MRKLRFLHFAGVALLTALFCAPATPAYAQQGPDYLQAISNLRMARAWIAADPKPRFADEENRATQEITEAIKEIKRAVQDDGRNANFTPPAQGPERSAGPLHTALTLLNEAYNDCARGMDYPQSAGLQVRALKHIGEARATLTHVVHLVDQGR